MKRKAALWTGILTMVLCLAMGFTAYAQGWEQEMCIRDRRISFPALCVSRRHATGMAGKAFG